MASPATDTVPSAELDVTTAKVDAAASASADQPASVPTRDVRRAREFYRYLEPDNLTQPHLRRRGSTFDVHHDHVPSLSHALAPFCQLAALRCNAAKAMLNVMDRDMMYFLAEASTKRSGQGAGAVHEFVEDPIFLECSMVPLKDRICEITLRMENPGNSRQICTFVINDLTQSKFAHMSIVAGPPFYRFYAGVPITTRDGINIGSLAIMDTSPRPSGLTHAEAEFLTTAAEQAMTYLETNRQAIEGRRSRRMAEGLEAFIAGRRTTQRGAESHAEKTLKKRAKAAYGIALESDHDAALTRGWPVRFNRPSGLDRRSDSIVTMESDADSSSLSSDGEDMQQRNAEGESRSHSQTFARAANLLRESIGDLGEEGSVHFLTLSTRLVRNTQNGMGGNAGHRESPVSSNVIQTDQTSSRSAPQTHTIASSTYANPFVTESDESAQDVRLDDDVLRDLMRRYPGGQMWSLEESAASSSDDDSKNRSYRVDGTANTKTRRTSRRKRCELRALRAAFPCARQLLFTPVWDATVGSFTYGCFITAALETRSFSLTAELPFLNSFCSTVMAECSRLDTMMADKQKSDFVGTISHEMRSPLHGVLASIEFLAETELTSFQRSLIETVDSCGRTLLDTINHVLDYSKVNSFQKNWQAANKRNTNSTRRNNYLGPENSSKALSYGAPPLLQLFGLTDISCVLEEVVDGLVLGHTYSSGIDITDTSKEARGRANGSSQNAVPKLRPEAVEVFIDIQNGDWTFMTQPGAVRRIIMNITGNAIKYTSRGTINVQLQMKESTENTDGTKLMVLTVSDTGKGISSDFLDSRLFMPFAQENALAPGTGLGLSIVHSIVLMLGGTIDVKSKIGKGTTVEVVLPMKRPLPGQVSAQTTPHSGGTSFSAGSAGDDSITLLQSQAADATVVFYRRTTYADDTLLKTVKNYVRQWYNLEFVDQQLLESAAVVIVEEQDLENLMTNAIGTPGRRPALVVMCSVMSRLSSTLVRSLEERLASPVEFVAKPCGPNKLARSIRQALENKHALKPRFPQVANLDAIPEAVTPGSSNHVVSSCGPVAAELQQMDLNAPGASDPAKVVQATETFAASQLSHNAQMAINGTPAGLRTPRTQMSDCDSFPFPVQAEEKSRRRRERNRSTDLTASRRVSEVSTGHTESSPIISPPPVQAVQTVVTAPVSTKIDPYILLVDDNKINLRLLETYLKTKRKYTRIEKAEDGQQAVTAATESREQFDIIFMDVSMPVMNGFEATRAIRDFEERCQISPGAMIIALTGLASGRDQSEGFDSGCDIYMTKPVSFKEVGRLLDNWESHQQSDLEQDILDGTARLSLSLGNGAVLPAKSNLRSI